MTATQITGGSVKYTVPSNYNSGKDGCEATIHFTVAEGDGANAHSIADVARTEAMRLATGTDRPYAAPFVPAPAPTPAASTAPQEAQPAQQAIIPGPGTTVVGGQSVTTVAPPSEATVVPLPSSILTPPSSEPTPTVAPAASEPASGASIIGSTVSAPAEANLGQAVVTEISDAKLREAVEAKVRDLSAAANGDKQLLGLVPVKVQNCLAQWVAPPGKVYALTQEQRPAFLAALAQVA
jgi:hypothetical protein